MDTNYQLQIIDANSNEVLRDFYCPTDEVAVWIGCKRIILYGITGEYDIVHSTFLESQAIPPAKHKVQIMVVPVFSNYLCK